MTSKINWCDEWSQVEVASKTDTFVNQIIDKIHLNKFNLHTKYALNNFELNLLYRWPIYVGTNLFMERFLKILFDKKMNIKKNYEKFNYNNIYSINTIEAITRYYYNTKINSNLLKSLSNIIIYNLNDENSNFLNPNNLNKNKENTKLIYNFEIKIKNKIKKIFKIKDFLFYKFFKPKTLSDYSQWSKKAFSFWETINFKRHYFSDDALVPDLTKRIEFAQIFKKCFLENIDHFEKKFTFEQKTKLSELFSNWINFILPISLVEGLEQRIEFYRSLTKNWKIQELHSFSGYYYNENFKIFAFLSKRNGSKLIGHSHGSGNCSYRSYKSFKENNELRFLDYYSTYGDYFPDDIDNKLKFSSAKIIPCGSAYLFSIKKKNKNYLDKKNFTLLYPAGPLMDYVTDLEEMPREINLEHRLKVLNLIDELLKIYPGLNVLYKPFPGTFNNDPIKERLSGWIKKKRIIIKLNNSPIKLFSTSDIVLWDTISTGFSESVAANIPTLVFNSKYELNQVPEKGKRMNEMLVNSDIQFFDTKTGLKAFGNLIKKYQEYNINSGEFLNKYKKDLAVKINPKEWRKKIKESINNNL